MRVLILGGSSEASALARLLVDHAGIDATLSLAGRTQQPASVPIAIRIGGFGGVEGLVAFLESERIAALVDATHPFAARMSRQAAEACARLNLPRLVLTRAPWKAAAGDRWIDVADTEAAVAALGKPPRRVFLTIGRLSLPAFATAPQHHYVIRSIDAPKRLDALPHHRLILARPPFGIEAEMRLMREERIGILVSKNSGGEASYAKIEAARRLALPVVMIRRPEPGEGLTLHDAQAALAWILRQATAP
jgi:precorrin-6A/cobalt-precorrin-6A reductase